MKNNRTRFPPETLRKTDEDLFSGGGAIITEDNSNPLENDASYAAANNARVA